jgi:hypothetical protein
MTSSLPRFVYKQLTQQISRGNAATIVKFIECQKTETNLSDNYKTVVIIILIKLIRYKNKNFKQLTKSDIIRYLDSLRKSEEGSRTIPLFSSIPYIKDWKNNHPQPGNPNTLLIPSYARATLGRKLSSFALNRIYYKYRSKIFPSLLIDENVPIEDKNKIRELLKKPWNPYIRRHTGLTEIQEVSETRESNK